MAPQLSFLDQRRFKVIPSDQIWDYATPNQKKPTISHDATRKTTVQLLFRSGRVFRHVHLPHIARMDRPDWFAGVVRRGRNKLWALVLLVEPGQFIALDNHLNGSTRRERVDQFSVALERWMRSTKAEETRLKRLAALNGDIRRVRELNATGSHTEAEWLWVLHWFGGRCARCGSAEQITKDHIVPIVNGGSQFSTNLQPLCRPCNSWKGARSIDFRDNPFTKTGRVLAVDDISGGSPSRKGQPGHVNGGSPSTPLVDCAAGGGRHRLVEEDQAIAAVRADDGRSGADLS
jgi:5-methylcytosine-specific restriction endonuclease McrA